nr:immunoglobulin heavy chain junction region [Macaca mulatta]
CARARDPCSRGVCYAPGSREYFDFW